MFRHGSALNGNLNHMTPLKYLSLAIAIFTVSCQSYADQKLTLDDTLRIRSLGLLDKDESIVKYTANYDKEVAGNFFTNKRIAHYWIDEHSSTKNSLGSAYFDEIISIDTIYNTTSITQASYLSITKKDGTKFNVYVDGSRAEVDSFFKPAILAWKKFRSF
jgi:hypothetical protein